MRSNNLAGLLPATRKQVDDLTQLIREALMSRIDTVLHHIADKIDASVERISGELDRLASEAQRGKVSPETVQRVKESLDKLHNVVPEVAEEDNVDYEPDAEPDDSGNYGGPEEQPETETGEGVGSGSAGTGEEQPDQEGGGGYH